MNQALSSLKRKYQLARRDWEDESRKRRRLRKQRLDGCIGHAKQQLLELDYPRKQSVVIEMEDGTRILRRQLTAECTVSIVRLPIGEQGDDGEAENIAQRVDEGGDDGQACSSAPEFPASGECSKIEAGLTASRSDTDVQPAQDALASSTQSEPSTPRLESSQLNPDPSSPPNLGLKHPFTSEEAPVNSIPPSLITDRPPIQKITSWLSRLDCTARGAEWARLPPRRPYEADQWHVADLGVGESATVMAWSREGGGETEDQGCEDGEVREIKVW